MAAHRIARAEGLDALAVCRAHGVDAAPRTALATAVRFTLHELAEAAPGRSLEVRVPPFAAVQCLPGPSHRRGTPPSVVETDPATWVRLALGELTWAEAVAAGSVVASGQRADLGGLLPLGLAPPR
ncbi:MAG: sterol carrier family protein [Dermatophilaceae bacterium]